MKTEQSVLKTSIAMTGLVAMTGILFGIFSGSGAIIFDGIYSLTDAIMTSVSLLVANLITAQLSEKRQEQLVKHFTMGFWHLEPIVLGLNAILLTGSAFYALVTAIGTLLSGGHDLDFGLAIGYTAVVVLICIAMTVQNLRANRQIQSDLVALDAKGWMMAAALTGALLIAFIFGWLIRGTQFDWLVPYVDPAVLALVCLIVIPLPLPTIKQALADILLVTPPALKQQVDEVAARVVEREGFIDYRAYVARVGRGRQIEIYFIVPANQPAQPLEHWDGLRDIIGKELGEESPDRWLTIAFTTDLAWAE